MLFLPYTVGQSDHVVVAFHNLPLSPLSYKLLPTPSILNSIPTHHSLSTTMGRAPCCEKAHTNKGTWTKEEDQRLISYVRTHGEGCWRSLPKAAGSSLCFLLLLRYHVTETVASSSPQAFCAAARAAACGG